MLERQTHLLTAGLISCHKGITLIRRWRRRMIGSEEAGVWSVLVTA